MPMKQVQDPFPKSWNPNISENRTFALCLKFGSNSFGHKCDLLAVFIYYILHTQRICIVWLLGAADLPHQSYFAL